MIRIRRSRERGYFNHGWLETFHTFSFAEYQDPEWMGYRTLRVLNEDRVHPGRGFDTHGHRDMEIVTYVLEGALEHRDSLGNGSVIRPGQVQRMTAGTGVRHSEFNPSREEDVHLLQIWILPDRKGLDPGYEEIRLEEGALKNRLGLLAAPEPHGGSVRIHQDARIYGAQLDAGASLDVTLAGGRHAWVQIARGEVRLGTEMLAAGDGAAVSGEPSWSLRAALSSEILVFDLA